MISFAHEFSRIITDDTALIRVHSSDSWAILLLRSLRSFAVNILVAALQRWVFCGLAFNPWQFAGAE